MCGNDNLVSVVNLGDQCLTGVFPAGKEQLITSGPLELVKCVGKGSSSCGLVQLRHSYNKAEMYGDNYGYHSSLNSSMVVHLKDIEEFCLKLAKPAPHDIVVDIGSNDGKVYSLNASTGEKLWDYTTGNWVIASPVVSNGTVYIGSSDNSVYALNSTTGAFRWSYATGGLIWANSPAVKNGVVYTGSGDGKIYALDALSGSLVWSYTPGGAADSSPAIAD